ncbi:MAG: nucleoside recognition domain-containing protein [Anaerovoracaceae bacterium]
MLLTFYLTFGALGPRLGEIMSRGIDKWVSLLDELLVSLDVSHAARSLIIEGACAGVGSVLSFIPVIGVLFFCLSALEETGYLDMLARIMDRFLRRLGIPGQIMVPLIMGFGCSVPAILAAGEIKDARARNLALALIPFMSCSAKLPLYGMMTSVFFPERAGLVTCSLYIIGIMLAVAAAAFLGKIMPTSSGWEKTCRMPHHGFKRPDLKKVVSCMWENICGFFRKAFTVILVASVIIWFLENYGTGLAPAASPDESLLAAAGKLAAPIFTPLGFGDWQAAAALITGLSAKEAVVSTLTVMAEGVSVGGSTGISLPIMLAQIFTPLSAFSFLVFCLLYAPCAASMAAMAKTSGSIKHAFFTFVFQTALAWLAAFITYHTGQILCSLIF